MPQAKERDSGYLTGAEQSVTTHARSGCSTQHVYARHAEKTLLTINQLRVSHPYARTQPAQPTQWVDHDNARAGGKCEQPRHKQAKPGTAMLFIMHTVHTACIARVAVNASSVTYWMYQNRQHDIKAALHVHCHTDLHMQKRQLQQHLPLSAFVTLVQGRPSNKLQPAAHASAVTPPRPTALLISAASTALLFSAASTVRMPQPRPRRTVTTSSATTSYKPLRA